MIQIFQKIVQVKNTVVMFVKILFFTGFAIGVLATIIINAIINIF